MHNELFPFPEQPKIILTVDERYAVVHLIRYFLYREAKDHIDGTRLRDIFTALQKLERKDYGGNINL